MASRFWVGGTGTWDATTTTHWSATSGGASGASVPTTADDVFIDANSGTGTITVSASTITSRNLDCTGYTGALTISTGGVLTVWGNLKFVSGMTLTQSGTLNVRGNLTTNTITTGGKSVGSFGVGSGTDTGKWTLQDAFTSANSLIYSAGTLDTNNQSVSVSIFQSSAGNTRVLTLGSSSITVSAGGTAWNISNTTNLTISTNTATITSTGLSATVTPGNISQQGASVAFTGGGASVLGGAATWANVTYTGTATKTCELQLSSSPTITGTFTVNGNSSVNRILVRSNTVGTARTVTSAANSISNADFADITGAGAASWNLSAITGSSGDAGGNSGITFTAAVTRYAVVAGNWSSTAMWATSSGGAGGASFPLPQDTVILDASSGAGTYTIDMPRAGKDLTCTGFTRTLSSSTAYTFYGSITLASTMNFPAGGAVTLAGRGTHTITMATKQAAAGWAVTAPGATYTLQDSYAYSAANALQLNNGTVNTNNQSATIGTFGSNNSNVRALTLGTSTVTLTATGTVTVWNLATNTNLTLSATSSTITVANATVNTRTINVGGAGNTYGTLSYVVAGSTGGLTLVGTATWGAINFSDATNARTLTLPASTTTTVTNVNGIVGTAGALMSVVSSSAGTAATLATGAGGSMAYVSLQDITATPASTVYALDSVDVSGNTGVVFEPAAAHPSLRNPALLAATAGGINPAAIRAGTW